MTYLTRNNIYVYIVFAVFGAMLDVSFGTYPEVYYGPFGIGLLVSPGLLIMYCVLTVKLILLATGRCKSNGSIQG